MKTEFISLAERLREEGRQEVLERHVWAITKRNTGKKSPI